MPRLRVLSVFLLICALSTGCTHAPKKDGEALALEQMTHWRAKGKLGITTDNKASAINFDWKNNDQAFNIRLYGLLGMGSARLTRDQGQVVLETKDRRTSANSADELLYQALGWPLPVEELVHWIKGMASPDSPLQNIQRDTSGNILHLQQQGWKIDYRSYHEAYATTLPKKIIARREGLKLTIAIKSWQY